MPIEKVIGFNQDGDAAGALIETTGSAGASLELGEAAFFQLLFQGSANGLGTFRGATSTSIIFTPLIDADEEVALPLTHALGWQAQSQRQITDAHERRIQQV